MIAEIVGARELFEVGMAVLESVPECVEDSAELQRAVALDAMGAGRLPVQACDVELPASEFVRQLGLAPWVQRRRSSRWN